MIFYLQLVFLQFFLLLLTDFILISEHGVFIKFAFNHYYLKHNKEFTLFSGITFAVEVEPIISCFISIQS